MSRALTATDVSNDGIAVWANNGEDKVSQEQCRLATSPDSTINSVWDGGSIKISAARNETTSFNLILEAAEYPAAGF